MKQTIKSIQTPEEAKLISFRDCFEEIGDIKFAALLFVINCILSARTCCLYRAADFAGNNTSFSANYTRLLRFFATGIGESLQKGVFLVVLQIALSSGTPCFLAIDRTDWKKGDKWCNLLVIGLVFNGYLIPLVWVDIGHRGNSNVQSRLDLLDKLVAWWPHDKMLLKSFPLLADREFAGEFWLLKIAKRGFSFIVRVKSNRKLTVWTSGKLRSKKCKITVISRFLRKKRLKSIEIAISDELLCHLVCSPNTSTREKEPYIYLFTNIEQPDDAGLHYSKRWNIETCFGHLKTNGFDLEAQGFKKEHKLEILLSVVTLIYAVCLVNGVLNDIVNQVPQRKTLKKYANGTEYRIKSLFRTGLTLLINRINTLNHCILDIINELSHCFSEFYTKTKIVV
jgi:Transposase DDE domain